MSSIPNFEEYEYYLPPRPCWKRTEERMTAGLFSGNDDNQQRVDRAELVEQLQKEGYPPPDECLATPNHVTLRWRGDTNKTFLDVTLTTDSRVSVSMTTPFTYSSQCAPLYEEDEE